MQGLLIGLVAVPIGGALCFRGYAALPVVIAVWGAFAGFRLGAGVIAGATGSGSRVSVRGWGRRRRSWQQRGNERGHRRWYEQVSSGTAQRCLRRSAA